MATETPLASTPTADALTQLLVAKSEAIDSECQRLVDIGDAESLHDLRVAMRRLHSLFAGFAHCFRQESPIPETLHALFKETNHARDLEVTLALLQGQQLALPWLAQQWRNELESEHRRLRKALPPRWQSLSQGFASPELLLTDAPPATTLGRYAAEQAALQEKKLLTQMKRIHKKWDDKRAHKLRIRGKRLRYLLEPFAEQQQCAAKAVSRLKVFQDRLGDYHDLLVLRQRLRPLLQSAPLCHPQALRQARQKLKQVQCQRRRDIRHHYLAKAFRQLRSALDATREELAEE
jgi:CHAD domain-containing protein